MGNLKRLQEGLKKLWTDERYSEQFRASTSPCKDFDHALKHIRKAAQELENMTEEADHSGASGVFDAPAVRKYVADIVISAVRLANVSPAGPLDVEEAVFQRIERKMGGRIEPEGDAEEERLKTRVQALRAKLWDLVRQWDDPSDRNYHLCGLCGTHEYEKHQRHCLLSE